MIDKVGLSEWENSLKNLNQEKNDNQSSSKQVDDKGTEEIQVVPRLPGLHRSGWSNIRTEEADRAAVEEAERHLLALIRDPYYHEAAARLAKNGTFNVDDRRLRNEKGSLAGKHQWPKEKQPLSKRHRNFGSNRKYSAIDDATLVFIAEMAKAAALKSNERIGDAEALIRFVQKKRPKSKYGGIAQMVRNKLAPRISRIRRKLSKEQLDVIVKAASERWIDLL